MRRKNIRTFVTSCLQKVRLGLRAWADRDQGNLRGLTLTQIPQTAPCGLSPLKKMGLNVCCRESAGCLAREGIFLLCFLSTGARDPEGRHHLSEAGKKTYYGDIVRQGSHQVSWFLTLLLCTQSWIALWRYGKGKD